MHIRIYFYVYRVYLFINKRCNRFLQKILAAFSLSIVVKLILICSGQDKVQFSFFKGCNLKAALKGLMKRSTEFQITEGSCSASGCFFFFMLFTVWTWNTLLPPIVEILEVLDVAYSLSSSHLLAMRLWAILSISRQRWRTVYRLQLSWNWCQR